MWHLVVLARETCVARWDNYYSVVKVQVQVVPNPKRIIEQAQMFEQVYICSREQMYTPFVTTFDSRKL
jgi:hypothetical protein